MIIGSRKRKIKVRERVNVYSGQERFQPNHFGQLRKQPVNSPPIVHLGSSSMVNISSFQ